MYRRIRNTVRFLLANVSDFDFARDAVPVKSWVEVDRYAIAMMHELQTAVLHDYGRYEFHFAAQKLHNFCAEFLSAFYLDILKDRLYTTSATGVARRSAQTVLYHITQALLRLFGPILSFTADEAWEHFLKVRNDSVFLNDAYVLPTIEEAETLKQRWAAVREVRSRVQKQLEALRVSGAIGSPLAAEVEVHAKDETYRALAHLGDDLRFVFITSAARVLEARGEHEERIAVEASRCAKCPRCWHYRPDIGSDAKHPELCGRCVANLYGAGEQRVHA
jgi:isoleucyl-tRNA synthetase